MRKGKYVVRVTIITVREIKKKSAREFVQAALDQIEAITPSGVKVVSAKATAVDEQ